MTALRHARVRHAERLLEALDRRNIVFVGIMGAGKSAIGRRVATVLGLPFIDSDREIEDVSRMTIPELFEQYGEPEFRALEERVLKRLLAEGPRVVATGGGAFMNPEVRTAVATNGVSVWLRAELDTLMDRVRKKKDRPLLRNPDPRGVMEELMRIRYPLYAKADLTIQTRDAQREIIADEVLAALAAHLGASWDSAKAETGGG